MFVTTHLWIASRTLPQSRIQSRRSSEAYSEVVLAAAAVAAAAAQEQRPMCCTKRRELEVHLLSGHDWPSRMLLREFLKP